MRAAAVIVALLATRAFADSQPDADAHARRGVALYNLGKYEDAIVEFEQAYTLVQSEALLFNLAQAHRQLDHCEQAFGYYKRFMAGTPAPALAAQVQALLPKLEAACKTKDEPPAPETTASTSTGEVPVEEPAPAVVEIAPARSLARLRATAALTAGAVISNKTAPTAGVAGAIATPWQMVEIGAAVGVAKLWRSEGERDATLSHIAATVRFASEQSWARLTIGGALGATHISSLDTSSGVVPGVRRAGLWMPLARAEVGAEHRVAETIALRVALALGMSPRSGPMLESMTQVDLLFGVRYER